MGFSKNVLFEHKRYVIPVINLIGKGDFEKEKETGGTPIQWKDTVILPTVCFQDVLFGELIKTNFEARKMREKRIVAEMDSIGFGAGSVTSASPRDPRFQVSIPFPIRRWLH